jgi:hypothetical protein
VTLALLASAESATIAWLLEQSEITAVVANRISTVLQPDFPQVRVTRVSGVPEVSYIDLPRVQIECWGDMDDSGEAMDLLSRTIAAAVRERGEGRTGDIAGLQVIYGPVQLNDPVSNRSRYLLDVTFAAMEETT